MIKTVTSKKYLNQFIYFVKDLYKDEDHYIYPVFSILKKELRKKVLQDQEYKAILSLKDEIVRGRLLYTFTYNQKRNQKICYFSFCDLVDNQAVFDELFQFMEEDMIDHDIYYSEGTFTPYDPDNRRGVLVQGFDDDPVIFTTYNFPYYQKLYENYGFNKVHDTHSLHPKINLDNYRKLKVFNEMFSRRFKVEVSPIDLKNIDQEIEDIHEILQKATTDVIYQEAPSLELIKSVAENLRFLLKPEIVVIARETETKAPIGFAICLLDYNQIFKITKGKIKILKFLRPLKYINRSRGMMQYVVPKYQSTGLIVYMYDKIYDSFKKMGINRLEAGTIMEDNLRSMTSFAKFGGEAVKTYRIYGKEISR